VAKDFTPQKRARDSVPLIARESVSRFHHLEPLLNTKTHQEKYGVKDSIHRKPFCGFKKQLTLLKESQKMDDTDLIACAKCVEKQKQIEQLELTMNALHKRIQLLSEIVHDYQKLNTPVTTTTTRSSMGVTLSDSKHRRDTIENL
jgi:hypothetical protein